MKKTRKNNKLGLLFAGAGGEGMQEQGEAMLLRLVHAGEQGRRRFGDLVQILSSAP